MKKNLKRFLTVLCAVALAMNLMSINAFAAAPDNTAFLSYADTAWMYQYWGDPVDTGVVATDAVVTGVGQYTVGLDFTGTADGKALGLSFVAPQIQSGELNFPGYFIQIDSIVINGSEIEFTKNYTSSDDAITTRSNVYNAWVAELPVDARTVDGSLDGAAAVIVDPMAFAEVETISLTFTLLDADGNGPVEEVAEVAEVADDTAAAETDIPKTGVVSFELIYGLGAIATGLVVLKKKEK